MSSKYLALNDYGYFRYQQREALKTYRCIAKCLMGYSVVLLAWVLGCQVCTKGGLWLCTWICDYLIVHVYTAGDANDKN